MHSREKTIHQRFTGLLILSLLVHVGFVILVLNTKLPDKAVNQATYETWVKDISKTKRRAIILPEIPRNKPIRAETIKGMMTAHKTGAPSIALPGERVENNKKGKATKEGGKRALANSGLLGIIGASSGKGGKKSDLANIFSAKSGKISDDLSNIMKGKKSVALARSSNLSQVAFKGEGGSGSGKKKGSGPADIGGIKTATSAEVRLSSKQDSKLPKGRVFGTGSALVTGDLEQHSVMNIIARKNSSFTRCYERSLSLNPNLQGRVGYELDVSKEGNVLGIRFVEDALKSRQVLNCVRRILARLNFPKPKGGPAIISSVFVFGTT
ncbi:MAG: AgmX/PglI C-terminal domain-containing protein [Deltaproteobacteria bacterium]|nr:AgmX/PglI C-terminal domain-containing protein [Deltaproteobacteria bacterium]